MSKFKMLGLRRRTTTVKSHMPGQAPTTSLDGIELVLEYVPTNSVITFEEEKAVVDAVKTFSEKVSDGIFLDLDAKPVVEFEVEKSDWDVALDAAKWKAKYEEVEKKRRGLQLKVNEYKRKLGLSEEADTTAEPTTGKSGKGKGKVGA